MCVLVQTLCANLQNASEIVRVKKLGHYKYPSLSTNSSASIYMQYVFVKLLNSVLWYKEGVVGMHRHEPSVVCVFVDDGKPPGMGLRALFD